MSMLIRNLAVLAKREVTYGTDAAPAVADAIQLANVKFTPIAGTDVQRNLVTPYLGNQGVSLTGNYQQIEFDVEMGGSGTAGTPPPYGGLLRATAMSETVVETTSVEYEPVSSSFDAASLYYFLDGTKYVMLGCRGKKTIDVSAQKKPILHFTLSGMMGTFTDTALPAADYSAWNEPLIVSKAATQFSFAGVEAPMTSLNIDDGQTVTPRFLVNYEAIEVTDRSMTGTLVIDQNLKAVKDWRQTAIDEAALTLAVTHGLVAGNTFALAAAGVRVGRLTHGDSGGVANYSLPLNFMPVDGNDELTLTFT